VVSGDREAFPATVFEQVNPALGRRIREYALQQLGPVEGLHAWDLYAGIGETTDQLRHLGATVESVELDRRAVELAERRSRITGHLPDDSQRPDDLGVVRHSGRAEELVGRMKDPAHVITNPPRTGMDRLVIEELVRRRPSRLVYVSCDPATLARDLGLLCGTSRAGSSGSGRFQVTAVQPFDLFPQTAHVETVVTLEAR
jgi:23S rRNA (uracil1939-C5)-methyltransferase